MKTKTIVASMLIASILAVPSISFASSLTQPQVNAIISVLLAFGVDQQTIQAVQAALAPVAPETSIAEAKSPQVVQTSSLQAPRVNTRALLTEWQQSRYFKANNDLGFALYGTVNAWTDMLVRQGSVNISYASQIEYFIDGVSIGHPEQRGLGDFTMAIDTTKLTNGRHELKIKATNGAGTDEQTALIEVKN